MATSRRERAVISYESKVVIDRPPETVFRFLIEPEKQAQWADLSMRPLTDGPPAQGTRMEISFGMGPIKARIGLEYKAFEPGRRLAFGTFSGPIRWEGEYLLEPTGDGTTLSQHGSFDFKGLWRLVEPIVGAEIKSGEIKELEKLKAVAEAA
jgi:uncharacterized protein YndB with AHSA1/START domain